MSGGFDGIPITCNISSCLRAHRRPMLFPNEGHPAAIGGFEVLERLGTGGAGQVYLARSKGGRLVAVKVLGEGAIESPEVAGALAHEASLCVRLSHPAIVQVRAL